ncbi:uncharacterized protein LOC127259440 [Andrographis paniculata]|uniref:uncharacterized protein LOC127259440 n=1 Tax=Andrographis paniculata TaxID=175694 RepID=UPI0021E70CBB|nr:uncharacterized protein LOC127259440 [Andrographis paniculata]
MQESVVKERVQIVYLPVLGVTDNPRQFSAAACSISLAFLQHQARMKLHPHPHSLPGNRRITLSICRLRRLPHIFAKVLELPFPRDTAVSVVETPDSLVFRVAVATETGEEEEEEEGMGGEIRAEVKEIRPGMSKIVVRGGSGSGLGLGLAEATSELEVDMWRVRLPDLVRAELAEASYEDGQLAVKVPKDNKVA